MFNKIAIIGVGLMGGSIGQAVRKRRLAKEVIGVCRRKSSARKALKYKACDKAVLNLETGVSGADLVILAVPVGKIAGRAAECAKYIKKGAILTDVGSSKKEIVGKIERCVKGKINFIGSHPMAGSDKIGVQNSDGKIFEKAPLIMTKTKNTDKRALAILGRFWSKLGCRVFTLSPAEHDRRISFASFLPHAVSFALASSQMKDSVRFAGGSLKDTTRVASADPEIWRDIFLSAGPEVLKAVNVFSQNLEKLKEAIKKKDGKAIKGFLGKAKQIRDSIK